MKTRICPEDFASFSRSGTRTEGALETADKLMQEQQRPGVVGRCADPYTKTELSGRDRFALLIVMCGPC